MLLNPLLLLALAVMLVLHRYEEQRDPLTTTALLTEDRSTPL